MLHALCPRIHLWVLFTMSELRDCRSRIELQYITLSRLSRGCILGLRIRLAEIDLLGGKEPAKHVGEGARRFLLLARTVILEFHDQGVLAARYE